MKVVWICHFSNKEIVDALPLYKKVHEFAPWISNLITEFENHKEIELHIIAPYFFIKRFTQLNIRGIYYYFLPTGIPFYHRYYPHYLPIDVFFNYNLFNKRVKNIISKINPDVINLIGAENAYYSTSVLQFKGKYPVIVTIQGFISEIPIRKYSIRTKHRAKIELEILQTFDHFIGEEDSKRYIEKFNPKIRFFKAYFPPNESIIKEVNEIERSSNYEYDCIYFGRLDENKGIFEFIKVINELKKTNPKVKGVITGPGAKEPIIKEIEKLNCTNNIEVLYFIENQFELFKLVKKSKLVLIPSFFDRLPSTIRESMLLKVPVIAYKTGGIPIINNERENIVLVNRGDYIQMSKAVTQLLADQNYYNKIKENAFEFASNEFSAKNNVGKMIEAYRTTIEDYNK